jgi:hypothetical protein
MRDWLRRLSQTLRCFFVRDDYVARKTRALVAFFGAFSSRKHCGFAPPRSNGPTLIPEVL